MAIPYQLLAGLGGLGQGLVQGQNYATVNALNQLRTQALQNAIQQQQQAQALLPSEFQTLTKLQGGQGFGAAQPQFSAPQQPSYSPGQIPSYPLSPPSFGGGGQGDGTQQTSVPPTYQGPFGTAQQTPLLQANAPVDTPTLPVGMGGGTSSPFGPGTTPTQYGGGGQISPVPESVATLPSPFAVNQQSPAAGGVGGYLASLSQSPAISGPVQPNYGAPASGGLYGPPAGADVYMGLSTMSPYAGPQQPSVDGYTPPSVPDQGTGDWAAQQPQATDGGGGTQYPWSVAPDRIGGGYGTVIQLESGGNMKIGGPGRYGEIGPAQITPDTWKEYSRPGEDIWNPQTNLAVGKRVYDDLYRKSGGDLAATLVGYNRGEGAMRRFQAGGDNLDALRGTSMMPTAAYQRAIEQAKNNPTAVYQRVRGDLDSMTSPRDQVIGRYGAANTLRQMPNPLAVSGTIDMGGLARFIDKANPNLSDTQKMMVFKDLYPMLSAQAKEDFAERLDIYKEQVALVKAGEPKFGAPADYEIVDAQGNKRTATGVLDEHSGQIFDPVTQRPLTQPGDRIVRTSLGGAEGGGKYGTPETVQILDANNQVVRTVPVRTKAGQAGWFEITPDGSEKPLTWDTAKGEHAVQTTPGVAAGERHAQTEAQIGGSVDDYAKAVAEYRRAPLSGWVMKSQWGHQVMDQVFKLNPKYDEAQWIARTSGARALASGQLGNTLQSMNVVANHIAILSDLVDALHNQPSRTWNRFANALQTEFGWSGAVDFNAAKQIVADEIAKAVIGGRNAERDREGLQESLSAASDPRQLKSVIDKFEDLIGGQFSGLHNRIVKGGLQSEEWFQGQLDPDAQEMFGRKRGQRAPSEDTGGGGGEREPSVRPPIAGGGEGTSHAGSHSALDVTKDQYDALPSGSAYMVPGNDTIMYKP